MRETAFLTLLLLITHISLKALSINIVAHISCGNLGKKASSLFLKPNDLDPEMFSAMRSEGDIIDFMLVPRETRKLLNDYPGEPSRQYMPGLPE